MRSCMTQRALSWDELRTFIEVARDGSLSGAAPARPDLAAGLTDYVKGRTPISRVEL
jgi:hypothetical protein